MLHFEDRKSVSLVSWESVWKNSIWKLNFLKWFDLSFIKNNYLKIIIF